VHSVERRYLRQCSDCSWWRNHFKSSQYVYVGFSRRIKIPCCSAYTISEKAMRFQHLDYNTDRTEKLISCPMSMSLQLSTRNISCKSMHAFLRNLANRQDRQTNTGCFWWQNSTFRKCFSKIGLRCSVAVRH